jgi:hypothetical protein
MVISIKQDLKAHVKVFILSNDSMVVEQANGELEYYNWDDTVVTSLMEQDSMLGEYIRYQNSK